jgi:two-component system sporulation sensor kinase A
MQSLLAVLKGRSLFSEWEDRTMEWLAPFLPRQTPLLHTLIAPLATSSDLYGFVGITSRSNFTGAHRRILPLAVSQLVTVWEENTVLQRGSQMASMGELTAEFAHDLRNPLSAIRHGLGFLSSQVNIEDPKNAEYIEVLNVNLQRIEWLINEMIAFSRPSERTSGRVRIDSPIERVVQVTGPVTEQKNIALEKHLCEEKLVVLADENELVEALVNIVMNSVQASARGGKIGIRTRSEKRARPGNENGESQHLFARIDVTDNGHGIPPGEIHKVLGRFYTTKPNGTGLGLSVVQRVARKNLGWVELESRVGEGTTVSLFFPQV